MRPGERITVDGQACLIVRDAVADRMPAEAHDIVVLGRQAGRFFYVAGEELRRARVNDPNARAVGLWHLLSESQLVAADGLYVVYFDDDGNGQYLLHDNEAAFVGEVRDGKPVSDFGYAINLSHAKEIRTDGVVWRLPSEPSGEGQNAVAHRRKYIDRAAMVAGVVLLAGVAGAVWMYERDYELSRRASVERSHDLRVAVERIKSRLANAQAQRIGAWPQQAAALHGFLLLALRGVEFSADDVRVSAKAMSATVHASPVFYTDVTLPGGTAERKVDGSVVLRWRNPVGVQ